MFDSNMSIIHHGAHHFTKICSYIGAKVDLHFTMVADSSERVVTKTVQCRDIFRSQMFSDTPRRLRRSRIRAFHNKLHGREFH